MKGKIMLYWLSIVLQRWKKEIQQIKIDRRAFNLPVVMIESFFDDARIQKLIDFGNASEVHSNVTFCPIAAPTNWFWIIIIGGTMYTNRKRDKKEKMF